ncbi:glycosyltransferase [Ferruginibacter sp.]|uniref:glycosyltransferase family 4 protein n=1 Tax=Ferruginibacter sp. TaxID=1940288 RepID=UPI00374DDFC0
MKILIIIPDFPENLEDIKGGVQSALANLLKGFAIIDLNIRVITFSRSIKVELLVKYSSTIDIIYCKEGLGLHLINYMLRNSFIIKRHIREFNPDLVHFAMGGICLTTKIFGLHHIKQLVTIHGISFLEARLIKNLREKLAIYINEVVEALLIPNNIIHISKYSLQIKGITKKNHYTIIPNAVKPEYFNIPLKGSTENRLLYIGAIEQRKNILLILKIMCVWIKNGKSFTLEVLGDFLNVDYKNEVLSYVNKNQLSSFVKFYGWVSQSKVMEVLGKADILVICSKQETLPMVIIEGMAAGKVIISTDVGGIPEMIIDGETGFLYNVTNEGKLEEIFGTLHNNNSIIKKISCNAREKAFNTYRCDVVAKQTAIFYEGLLEIKETESVIKKINLKFLKFYEKFCIMQWGIGISNGDINQLIRSKKYDLTIKWLPTDNKILSIADPFIFKSPDGNINLLYENFSMAEYGNYGKIDLIVLDQDLKPIINKRLMDIKSHLSYPFIFRENGKTYVIPEAHQSNRVVAYEFDFGSNTLINEKILINNLPLIDSSVLKYKNKYWLFATLGGSNSDHSKLYIFYADTLFGNYVSHPNNPVKESLDGSRPAGDFIFVDGEIYRPAQNCAKFYGRSITINKIISLSENEFKEEPYMDLESQKRSYYNIGIHTINSIDNIVVVDGIRFVFMPFTKVYFTIIKMFKNIGENFRA